MYVYVCVCMCMYVYVCVCMCMYVYVCVCMRMYVCVCMYVCTYVRMYVYIYIHNQQPGTWYMWVLSRHQNCTLMVKVMMSQWIWSSISYKPVMHQMLHQTLFTQSNQMQPTNPNAHTYVNGTDVETHGYAVTQNTFCNSLFEQSCTYFPCYQSAVWSGKCGVRSVECVKCRVWSVEWKV